MIAASFFLVFGYGFGRKRRAFSIGVLLGFQILLALLSDTNTDIWPCESSFHSVNPGEGC